MIPVDWVSPVVAPLVMMWQESGENAALFCYRIGWGTYLNLRSRVIVPNPETERYEVPCSNTSVTCSTTCLMSKG